EHQMSERLAVLLREEQVLGIRGQPERQLIETEKLLVHRTTTTASPPVYLCLDPREDVSVLVFSGERLGIFDQHTVLRLRMEGADHAREPASRLLVDERDPLRFRRGELCRDVIGRKADVVQPFTALLEELRNSSGWVDRLEELDLALAQLEKRRAHPLIR